MPYIEQTRRTAIDSKASPVNAGELNYLLTTTILAADEMKTVRAELLHICRNYIQAKGLRYQFINEVIGALTCAAFEFERRSKRNFESSLLISISEELYEDVAAPYEDEKIKVNGDIEY